jgi:hypothetical protein
MPEISDTKLLHILKVNVWPGKYMVKRLFNVNLIHYTAASGWVASVLWMPFAAMSKRSSFTFSQPQTHLHVLYSLRGFNLRTARLTMNYISWKFMLTTHETWVNSTTQQYDSIVRGLIWPRIREWKIINHWGWLEIAGEKTGTLSSASSWTN